MARHPRPWTVLPHDPIVRHEDNLWSVSGRLERGRINRRMTIIRLSDGRLVCHNGVPLGEEDMRALEVWGRPAILVVPNGLHRLDVHAWKARYPDLTVLCPAPVEARVREVVAVDGHLDALPADPHLRIETLAGTKNGEGVLIVSSRGGQVVSLVFGDALMNLDHLPGFEGLVFRLLGSTGGPRTTRLARWMMVADAAALAAHFERLATLPGLARLVVSHGHNVEHDAPGVLRQVAARLRGG